MAKTVKITEPTWRKIESLLKKANVDMQAQPQPYDRSGLIRVWNYTGTDCPLFGALSFGYPSPIPDVNLELFKRQRLYIATFATHYLHTPGQYAIAQEPIKSMKVGWAMICGVTPALVEVTDVSHRYAELVHNSAGVIRSSDAGPFEIIYKQNETGQKWAVLRVGGAPVIRDIQWVKLTNTSVHPMLGKIARFDPTAGAFPSIPSSQPEVQVYRYPTYTDNTLYDVGNVIAAIREGHNVYVALDTLPRQLATAEYTGWNP